MSSSEKEIQDAVTRRVIEEAEKIEQAAHADANRDALADITSLSRTDVDRIAGEVREEILRKRRFLKTVTLYTAISLGAMILLSIAVMALKYNKMAALDQAVMEKWAQVENVYQRRYDLIPNLVETVKAYARHEKETLRMITEARSRAGNALAASGNILEDGAAFRSYQNAQSELSRQLQRALLTVENYPELKADQNFLALQAQLEGSENRIAVERKRFNEAVLAYNAYIKRLPQVVFAGAFGFHEKMYFKAGDAATPPQVRFD